MTDRREAPAGVNAAAIKARLSAHVRDGRLAFEIHAGRPVWRRRW